MSEDSGGQLPDSIFAERLERGAHRRRAGRDPGEQLPRLALRRSPYRKSYGDGKSIESPSEEIEDTKRRDVAPLRVIDAEEPRPLFGELSNEPVEAVRDR